MKVFKYLKSAFIIAVCTLALTTSNICTELAIAEPVTTVQQAEVVADNQKATPLAIVASPKNYLNKNVTFNAKFDKFSTLGLDYKPALKSSEEYISFLIKRDDTNFDIPLSEMKLFLKRSEAEKHIELKTNDEIEVSGLVFSDALGDTWIDVTKLTLIKKSADDKTE